MIKFNIHFRDELNLAMQEQYVISINKIMTELTNASDIDLKEIIFAIGGDGTFLEAVSKYGIKPLYIPINEGSLGFYTSWNKNNIQDIIQEIKNKNIVYSPLICIQYEKKNEFKEHYCLNESTIINPVRTQKADIKINNFPFEKFRGTGLCISTPSGSTAYNKSLGGALMNHSQEMFQLVKIAPINSKKYRTMENSILFSKNDILSINFEKENSVHSILTVDRNTYNIDEVKEIKFHLSDDKIRFLQSKNNTFWKRVKNSFL